MGPCFSVREGCDLCLIPFSPIYEDQSLEIRVQISNEGTDGDATVDFFFDSERIARKTVSVNENSYGFASVCLSMRGKAGRHEVSVKLGCENGTVKNGTASETVDVKKTPLPLLDGGFLMLGPPNDRRNCDLFRDDIKSLTEDGWRKYLDEMNAIGMDCLVIFDSQQFLSISEKKLAAHYPSELLPKSDITANDPIAAILDEAEKNGQRVFIGLGNPYGYEGAASEMTELEKRYGGYRSFYGWYFAAEVVMSSTAPEEMIKWDYYGKLYRCAHALAPAKPVLISPMAIPCRKVLRHIKGRDVFDIIMPQDWVGGLGHTLRQSKRMHKKLAAFCAKNGKHLWANCESFNWKDTVLVPRYRGGGMVGKAGFDKQLKVARPFAEKLLSFALTGFWCPKDFVPKCGGDAAVKQFCDYVNYRNEIKKER